MIQRLYSLTLLFCVLFLTVFRVSQAGAEGISALPVISRLDSRDTIFRQYISDVQLARSQIVSRRGQLRPDQAEELASFLTIYFYSPQAGEELMGIAARCNIPYGTIASLNRISNIEDTLGGPILLPSMPGIFVPETPGSDLEKLFLSTRADAEVLLSIPQNGRMERFYFFPGDDFSATERVFFLNRGFQFPLREFRLTSSFGHRINPVTGRSSMHQGLDLAAPEGAEVFAARSGTVADIGEDPILGNYVILSHDNNWVSFYGHLSAINTTMHTTVRAGSMIGRVGTTGQSTGPHLHFELRQDGQSRDPAGLLRLFRSTTSQHESTTPP